MPEFAKTYEFVSTPGRYPKIDGQEFPWWIHTGGPLVEDIGHGTHILWVPILIDAPMPTPPEGRPEGVPLAAKETP